MHTSGGFPGQERAGWNGQGMGGCEMPGWELRSLSPLLAPLSLACLLPLPLARWWQPYWVPLRAPQGSAVPGPGAATGPLGAGCRGRLPPGGEPHDLQRPSYDLRNHCATRWPWQPDQTSSLAGLAGSPQKRTPALGRRWEKSREQPGVWAKLDAGEGATASGAIGGSLE